MPVYGKRVLNPELENIIRGVIQEPHTKLSSIRPREERVEIMKQAHSTMDNREKLLSDYPQTLRVRDLQALLGISRDTAYRLVHQEGFPAKFVSSRCIRIDKDELRRWLSSQSRL